jgi:glycosyltransferase involved in cell wall biosynthesis
MPNLPSASQDSPLISIGMPAHNAERYVGAAIESVLRQTFGDWELIIINDGSTDATAERIASYRDPRIRWFSQENLGPPAAYNRALAQSRGRYFAILNADDVCYPDRLESQLRFYEGGGPRVLFSPVDFIDAEGNAVTGEHFLSGRFPAEPHTRAETVERFFTRGNFFSTPTLFTERKILLEAGLFHPALFTLQDFDMWVRLVKKHDLVPLPKPTVQYRIHPDNISGPPRNDQDFRRGVRVHNEYHLLMRRFFDGMPAELFHDAFKDRLIRPDCATDLEHRCEQAFLYLKSSDRRCQLIGLEKMDGLLADPEGARVLSDLYGFNSVSFAHGPLADVDVERIVPKPAAAQRDEPAIQSGHPPIDNYLARSPGRAGHRRRYRGGRSLRRPLPHCPRSRARAWRTRPRNRCFCLAG